MATAVLSSEEEQGHDSDDSNAQSEEVKKIAKIQKISQQDRTWSGSLICRLIAESMFVENFLTRHRKC